MIGYPVVELIRLEEHHQYGTFGVLRIQKEVFCVTLEPPDYLNEKSISCIPAQQYLCSKTVSPRFGETYEVRHVPGRSNVLFHAGNLVRDTEGCILLAQFYGKLKGDRAVLNSGNTFKEFLRVMGPYPTFHLTVREEY
jgi:hypothetical protein